MELKFQNYEIILDHILRPIGTGDPLKLLTSHD